MENLESKNKKAAIITIYGNDNYGNKLQNYALYKYLSSYGINVYTIANIKKSIFTQIKKQMKFTIESIKNINCLYRKINFKKFNKFLNYYPIVLDMDKNKCDISQKFDYFIYGSDQIWNYNYEGKYKLMQGYFTPKSRNFSYAASFGINEIPNDIISMYEDFLWNFKYISVRENDGQKIVEKLTKRKNIEVLIDPTMLLDSEEWTKVSKKPSMLKSQKFILNYFLGEISSKNMKEISKIAEENNCSIINIMDKKSPFYKCGPSEFLYLEKHAFLICTDSFHSTVFGILFNTPFLVFKRKDQGASMYSRLETLLSKFKLEDRKFMGIIRSKDLKIDCKEAHMILKQERNKSAAFIRKMIDSKDENINE